MRLADYRFLAEVTFKIACVVAVFKGGDEKDLGNYSFTLFF